MPDPMVSSSMARRGDRRPRGSMVVRWDRDAGLRTLGLDEHVLADGRACLIGARGSFFDSKDALRVEDQIPGWLAAQLHSASLREIAPHMNGCFAVVVVWPGEAAAEVALDRLAPIPIFVRLESGSLFVSDDFWDVAESSRSAEFDCDAVLSMAVAEHVVRPRTLLEGISVFANAAVHRITWNGGVARLASHAYWSLAFGAEEHRRVETWMQGLADTLNRIFGRYAHAISERGWTACIPLSGGEDSRLSLGLIRRHGARVQAFSYGPTGNDESLVAAEAAMALGVPFRFVPVDGPSYLTPELIRTMTRRVGMRARFTAGLGAHLSLGDYSPDDVFLPSHPGGLVAVGPNSEVSFLVRTEEQALRQIEDNMLLPVFDGMGAALFPGVWRSDTKRRIVRGNWRFDPRDPLGSMQRWEWENRHQMILSELRTYELSGRWLLPTSDYEFTDYYRHVPALQRHDKRLYTDALLHNLFIDDLACLGKIRIAFSRGFEVPPVTWKQGILMNVPLGAVGSWLLTRATRRKRAEQRSSIGVIPTRVSGPEPIDHWWLALPAFRETVLDMFEGWDGMRGLVDVRVLKSVLREPMPRLFVRLGIPALLTLRAFQEIVEHELDPRP